MELKRIGTEASSKGPDEYFTGNVRVDPLFEAPDPARARGASVTFEPGAHTAWHRHPLGQILIVTSGCGWVQTEGQPKVEIHGGPAPVRRFLPELIELVWNGKINPGKVFDLTLPLDQVAEGYRAMDERRAIKTLLRP